MEHAPGISSGAYAGKNDEGEPARSITPVREMMSRIKRKGQEKEGKNSERAQKRKRVLDCLVFKGKKEGGRRTGEDLLAGI